MDKFLFLMSEGFKNIWRHKATSFTAVFTLYVTLIIVGIFMISGENIQKILEYARSKYKVEVFYQQNVTDQEANSIAAKIKMIDGIRSTTVINKNDAIDIFKEQFGEDILILLGYNPLPASTVVNFERNTQNRLNFDKIIEEIKLIEKVEAVRHQGYLINKIEKAYQKMMANFPIVSGLIIFIAILVIYNTVKLSVYSRKNLIYSMQLIGATKAFIKLPFIFEGLMMGVISTVFVYPSLIGMVNGANYILESVSHTRMQLLVDPFIWIWLIGLAGIISILGSYRAIASIIK
jgi:cell division transport system permease protein